MIWLYRFDAAGNNIKFQPMYTDRFTDFTDRFTNSNYRFTNITYRLLPFYTGYYRFTNFINRFTNFNYWLTNLMFWLYRFDAAGNNIRYQPKYTNRFTKNKNRLHHCTKTSNRFWETQHPATD